jgi:hypothetical protein
MVPVSLIPWAVLGIALLSRTAPAVAEPYPGTPRNTLPTPQERSREDLFRLQQDLQRQRLQRLEYRQDQQRQAPGRPAPVDPGGIGR